MNSTIKIIITSTIMLFGVLPMHAQNKPVLFAGLANSKGYVVGKKLRTSGLHRFVSDTTWEHIGLNHPRVSGIAFGPRDPDVLYLACGNGALRSRDGGKSWRITTDWRVTEAQDIQVDPHAPAHIYLATAYGIWRSANGADTWKEANAGLKRKYTQAIRVDRAKAGRVLAATESGISLSENGAQLWTPAGPENVSALALAQSATQPQIWIAGTQNDGVLLSRDGGKSWRFARGPVAHTSIYAVAIDPFDARHLAAAGWDTGVFVSHDGGKTWRQQRHNLPVPHIYQLLFDVNQRGRLWAATVEEGIFSKEGAAGRWNFRGMYGALVFDLVFSPGSEQ